MKATTGEGQRPLFDLAADLPAWIRSAVHVHVDLSRQHGLDQIRYVCAASSVYDVGIGESGSHLHSAVITSGTLPCEESDDRPILPCRGAVQMRTSDAQNVGGISDRQPVPDFGPLAVNMK